MAKTELGHYLNLQEGVSVKNEIYIPRTPQGFEEKSYLYFDLDGQEYSVFTRKVEQFCLPTLSGFSFDNPPSYSELYLQAWKFLKSRGFTVVPEVWKMTEEKVATTNLTEDGSGVYDQKIDAIIERDTFETDRIFCKLPVKEVQNSANKLAILANNSGVELMTDGPFHIVVNPGGSWYVLPLDIGKVRIHSNPKELTRGAKHDNQYYCDQAVRAFSKIQLNIRALRDARGLP